MEVSFEQLLVLLVAAALGAFARPYLSKKGENLATKEDLQEIRSAIQRIEHEGWISFGTIRAHGHDDRRGPADPDAEQ